MVSSNALITWVLDDLHDVLLLYIRILTSLFIHGMMQHWTKCTKEITTHCFFLFFRISPKKKNTFQYLYKKLTKGVIVTKIIWLWKKIFLQVGLHFKFVLLKRDIAETFNIYFMNRSTLHHTLSDQCSVGNTQKAI